MNFEKFIGGEGSVGKCGIIQVRFLFMMHKLLLINFQYNIQESFLIQNPIRANKMKKYDMYINVDIYLVSH